MGWHAQLNLDYRAQQGRTAVHFTHDGPLRVLKSLYPEGPGICHNVLVHPPGGLVGGDVLDIAVCVGEGAHALVTTPGATRYTAASSPVSSPTSRFASGRCGSRATMRSRSAGPSLQPQPPPCE